MTSASPGSHEPATINKDEGEHEHAGTKVAINIPLPQSYSKRQQTFLLPADGVQTEQWDPTGSVQTAGQGQEVIQSITEHLTGVCPPGRRCLHNQHPGWSPRRGPENKVPRICGRSGPLPVVHLKWKTHGGSFLCVCCGSFLSTALKEMSDGKIAVFPSVIKERMWSETPHAHRVFDAVHLKGSVLSHTADTLF